MKVNLQIRQGSVCLHDGSYDVSDAESFGRAFADAWTKIQEQKMEKASSIGALMEGLGESVLQDIDNAQILIKRVR